jgi:hypothetical protein
LRTWALFIQPPTLSFQRPNDVAAFVVISPEGPFLCDSGFLDAWLLEDIDRFESGRPREFELPFIAGNEGRAAELQGRGDMKNIEGAAKDPSSVPRGEFFGSGMEAIRFKGHPHKPSLVDIRIKPSQAFFNAFPGETLSSRHGSHGIAELQLDQ